MNAAILTIGTELTRGELLDKNRQTIAELLTERGYEVTELVSVDDDDHRIIDALRRLGAAYDLLIVTGGLGPTTDDRTAKCAADALGVPLKRDPVVLDHIVQLFASRRVSFSPSNEKQADFPQGALVLENPHGTAPGFFLRFSRASALFFPGVPREMQPMLISALAEHAPKPDKKLVCLKLKTFGLPESEVNERLSDLEDLFHITLGYRASHAEIEVKVFAKAETGLAPPKERARDALMIAEERLGDAVYGEGEVTLAQSLGDLFREKDLSFALAESCTGGLISEMITAVPGASTFFLGGICSYDNSIKESLLKVSASLLREHGAVSEPVARAMAEEARRAFGADVTLSVTGIAGPGGGSQDKPVGLVHFAIAVSGETRTYRRVFRGDRLQIRKRAALFGIWSIRQMLLRAGGSQA